MKKQIQGRWALRPFSFLLAFLVVSVITAGFWWLREDLTLANISLIYIIGTFVVAVWLGTGPSLAAAFYTFFCFNFFLIKPYYTLKVEDPRELIDLLVYLLVAVIASQLAAYAREQAEAARRHAAEQNILYSLSSAFNQLTDQASISQTLEQQLPVYLPVSQVEMLPEAEKNAYTGRPDDEPTTSYLILQTGDTIYGTLRVVFTAVPTDSQMRLLMACTVQAAMALQRIQLTESAQRSHTLEEADRLKTALLRAVSHDLRTPLTIIKTSADNLIDLHTRLPEAEQLEMIQTISSEADHLNLLVGNLLDMSRLQAGAMTINRHWNTLEEVAGDVAARVWQRHQAERLWLNFPDDYPLAQFDYGLVLQAVSNVVENALRYEPPTLLVEIRGESDAAEVRLLMINHGPTIPDELKEQVMAPFFHGKDGRIGLGLAISKGIVDLHHGRMWVEDTPNGGATFVLALPREGSTPPLREGVS